MMIVVWLIGAISGAVAMYFVDPRMGNRRRALLRDKAVHLKHETTDTAEGMSKQMQNRARGIMAETRSRLSSDDVTDDILVARVRSELGPIGSHLGGIEVNANEGQVTVTGPIMADEVDRLLNRIRSVAGVKDVINRLQVQRGPSSATSMLR